MSRESSGDTVISPTRVEAYLHTHGFPDAEIRSLQPLGQETQAGLKAYGYGRPLQAEFTSDGKTHRIVIRTMSPDPFGHVRRADRAAQMMLCFDTFDTIPRHIHAEDLGAFDAEGGLCSLPPGEFFLITNYVEGELYAHDLDQLIHADEPSARDSQRASALADYLADLHRQKADPALYARHVRDTIGSGEGIFGQCDGYPEGNKVASRVRLRTIETEANRWRWKMHDLSHRCCRTHGDFHPFNILFREDTDFSVLDCSRGGLGEAADDVTCLSINFLFFAINQRGEFTGALRELWSVFWNRYLTSSADHEVLRVVAPYFMWRCLVVASPIWYPHLENDVRHRLLQFGERLLERDAFDPHAIDELLA